MKRRFTAALAGFLVFLLDVAPLRAAQPSIDYAPNGVTMRGIAPGTRVAWIAMLRDRVSQRSRMTIHRGLEPVTPNGDLFVETIGQNPGQSVWIAASVDGDLVLKSSAPEYPVSNDPIETRAIVGGKSVAVRSGSIHLAYVRRNGSAVWMSAAADGSDLDIDGLQDGWISISLASLKPFRGHQRPPEAVAAGDLILLIDPVEIRTTAVEVRE